MAEIIEASHADFDAVWDIFGKVIEGGDTYIYDENTTKEQLFGIWFSADIVYVIKVEGRIVGSCVLRPNKIGRGSHVANASFVIDSDCQGQGLGRKLGNHIIEEAKKRGFKALQFNYVVSTNERAVNLWKSLGMKIVGIMPKGYNHKAKGLVDVYIMHRFL